MEERPGSKRKERELMNEKLQSVYTKLYSEWSGWEFVSCEEGYWWQEKGFTVAERVRYEEGSEIRWDSSVDSEIVYWPFG